MPKLFTVNNDYHDSRFDKWFKKNVIDIPHSLIEKIIRQNKVKVNKKELGEYGNYIIENNENFVIINKPTGIPVQSGTKSFRNIVDILKDTIYFRDSKPYIVHRIDKETSGILIIAKNRKYAQLFTSLFRIRKIHKTYLAIVYGKVNKLLKTMKDDLIFYENKKKIIQKAITNFKILRSNES